MESWLMAVDRVRRYARSWDYIQGSQCNQEDQRKINNLGKMLYSEYAGLSVYCTRWMLCSLYTVLDVCCTRCMLYSVYAVLGVCCTRCMLYSVFAVLRVISWSWHGEIQRDKLTFCSLMMVELWTTKTEMRMKMRTMWRIQADMRNQGVWHAWLGWEHLISGIIHARSGLPPAVSGIMNWLAYDILFSPSFSWWFSPYPLISLFLVLNSTIT